MNIIEFRDKLTILIEKYEITEATVKSFDPDMEEFLPVTCYTYDNQELKIYTDCLD